MGKSLIVITGLINSLNKNVASLLSEKLAMFFLDIPKLVEFDLSQKEEIILKCGIDYYKRQEKKILNSVSNYENTVAFINYDLYAMEENNKMFSASAYSFYIRASGSEIKTLKNVDSLSKIAFEERDKILKNICNFVIELKDNNEEQIVNTIIEKLKEVAL